MTAGLDTVRPRSLVALVVLRTTKTESPELGSAAGSTVLTAAPGSEELLKVDARTL